MTYSFLATAVHVLSGAESESSTISLPYFGLRASKSKNNLMHAIMIWGCTNLVIGCKMSYYGGGEGVKISLKLESIK